MINKQSLWFLTLFSLILVLSVYYITMPNELLLTNNGNTEKTNSEVTSDSKENDTKVTIQESETLVTMRVTLEEEREKTMAELKTTLTSEQATATEKNDAYEQMKVLNELKAKESVIESQIKSNFSLDSFVKIDGTNVKVVVVKKDHDSNLANQIMKKVQENFSEKVYVTVKFEK
ncbi:MAG: SpoIIIAH-like family protein [Bacilli bacterium]|nr:SpoIIIAH-like family protein [Bacilli bacterium]